MQVLNHSKNKYLFPWIKQNNSMSCGPATLAIILKYYGFDNIQPIIEQKTNLTESGTSLYALSETAKEFGFSTKGLSINFEYLIDTKLPCVAHLENYHFVVVYKISKDKVFVSDPAVGKYEYSINEFKEKWNGIILQLDYEENEISKEKRREAKTIQEDFKKRKKEIYQTFFYPFLKRAKGELAGLLFLGLIQQLLIISAPILIKYLFDNGLSNKYSVITISLLLCGIYLLLSIIQYFKNNLFLIIKSNFEYNYFSDFFNHILNMKQIFFDRLKKEDFIFRFQENLKIRNYISARITSSLFSSLFIFIYLFVIFYINATIGVISLVLLILNLSALAFYTPLLLNNTRLNFHENNKVLGNFIDKVLGIFNLKILNSEFEAFKNWRTNYEGTLNKIVDSHFELNGFNAKLYLLNSLSKVAVVCGTLYLLYLNTISFGDFIAANGIFFIAMRSLNDLSLIVSRGIKLFFSIERISDFFFKETDINKNQPGKSITNIDKVQITNLSFSYTDDKNILDNICLDIKSKLHYGIVGRNGAGKTTLAKILAGFYDNYEGSIKVNGFEINAISKEILRKNLFLFPNEIYLFDTTIRENILLANMGATEDQLQEALMLADLDSFINGLYLGLDQRIGDRGLDLSSGEKLKLGFARLFLKKPSMIILDEATSSLDPETEHQILENVYHTFSESTIISIAHRINTLKKVDEIIVIDNGEIEEVGNHEDLYNREGIYHKFVNKYINY